MSKPKNSDDKPDNEVRISANQGVTSSIDEAKDINSSDEILKNSPDKLEGYFAVPKVVE